MKFTTSDVNGENTRTGIYYMIKKFWRIQKTQNLNLESFARNFNRFKKINLEKKF